MKKFTLLFTILFGFNQIMVAQDNFFNTLVNWTKPVAGFMTSYGFNIFTIGCIGGLWYQNQNLSNKIEKQDCELNYLENSIFYLIKNQNNRYSNIKKQLHKQKTDTTNNAIDILNLKSSLLENQRKQFELDYQLKYAWKITNQNSAHLDTKIKSVHQKLINKIEHDNYSITRQALARSKYQLEHSQANRLK